MTKSEGQDEEEGIFIRNLLIRRGGRKVLEVESLRVRKTEILAVLGPNGAGKSTLLLALARLIKPSAGEIWFNGKSAESLPALAYRRRIGLVMQDPLLFDASVAENIALGLRFRGISPTETARRVEEWMQRLGISALAKRRANELSGGEGQRVSLARALALEPELLLLDEPFSALDSPTRTRLVQDLKKLLQETGSATLFITHDPAEAKILAQKVALIRAGRLEKVQPAQDLPAELWA